jgi:hypothetical protein
MRTPKKHKMMTLYKNLSGDSKVVRYQIAKDALTIRFADCSVYIYTNQSAAPGNISKMKTLAVAGKGLGTFIETNLKERYARKIK